MFAAGLTPWRKYFSLAADSLVEAIPAVKGITARARKRPGKLHADRADASRAYRAYLRQRGIVARIVRYGVESREWLGRLRWVVSERSAGSTDFADDASAMSVEPLITKSSFHYLALSSVGGTSSGFVRSS